MKIINIKDKLFQSPKIAPTNPRKITNRKDIMPITAYSREAKCELDLTQWLARNGYSTKGALNISKIPQDLRIKATTEIECSCCEVIGASLVSESHSQKTGKQISQGHFRFGSNHHPFCDYFDESAETGSEYLTRFTDDKSEITKVIRQLVCNGIAAEIFTQADMRQMRVWFMHEKEKNSLIMPVTAELLQWYADASLMAIAYGSDYPFHPNQAQLSSFNWQESAKHEWARRNKHLFIDSAGRATHYAHKAIKRPLLLANRLEGKRVLDPTALREKYSDAVVLARFSAKHTFPGKKTVFRDYTGSWGTQGNAMLALSALLLFKSNWNLEAATSLFIRLKLLPNIGTGIEGNLIGLNPFHDYETWRIINIVQEVGAKRIDSRPVQEQISSILSEMQKDWIKWQSDQSL